MAMVTVQVWDATGNKRQEVEMPDDVAINRVLAVLLQRMQFPEFAPDGQPLSGVIWPLDEMLDERTLADLTALQTHAVLLDPRDLAPQPLPQRDVVGLVGGSPSTASPSAVVPGAASLLQGCPPAVRH